MNKINSESEFWEGLEARMKEYSDDEIVSILQKHRLYEPQARKIAVDEAISRGIIHSEQDLFSDRFKAEPPGFTLFPCPENPKTILKIARSLSRALLVAGVIPLIFGVLRFQAYKFAEGGAITVAALIWISSAWMLFRQQDKKWWLPLLTIALLSAVYAARLLILLKGLRTMDYLIPVIFYAVIFYALFYLRSLLVKSSRD